MAIDHAGNLWFICRDGLSRCSVDRDDAGNYALRELDSIPVCEGIVFACYADGAICFSNPEGILYRFDIDTRRMSCIFDLSKAVAHSDELSAIVCDGDDYLLSFEMSGLIRLHRAGSIDGRYEMREIDVNCGVFSLLKDRNQDIVWIGTDGKGLLRQYNGDVKIRSVGYESLPYALSKPIKALYVDGDDDLWIGTKNDGILRIRDFYHCTAFIRENTDSYTTRNSGLRHNAVFAFARSNRRLLWIGGDGGICYYSYATGRIVPLADCRVRNVHALYEDAEGTLWAGTIGTGVYCIRLSGTPPNLRVDSLRQLDLGENARRSNFFFSIVETPDSSLWFCNHGVGAFRYDRNRERYDEICFDSRHQLPVNEVTTVAACSDRTLWFGTGWGVTCYDAVDSVQKPTPEYSNELLRSGVIHGILCDSLDNLWVGTNAGIVRYTPASNQSVSFGASYGLGVVEFSDGAYFYDRRAGRLFFGGINGFVVIEGSSQASATAYMPPIQIGSIAINGKEYNPASLMRRGRLLLNHRQASFTLFPVALDYIDGGNYSYSYRIDGHGAWNNNHYNNQLVFANLSPGHYTLLIRYRNDTTGELSSVKRLEIRILPPPYASWWAIAAYIIVIGVIAVLLLRRQVRRRRIRVQRRQALYNQRQREILYESRIGSFAGLTTELSLPLTLIDGPCQRILEDKAINGFVRQQAEFIHDNARKMKDLIYILNEFKTGATNNQPDKFELLDVTRMVGSIAQTFSEYAERNGIVYRTAIGVGILFPSVPNRLTTLINLLLTNAFRRTSKGGEVSLVVSVTDGCLQCVITNCGAKLDREYIALIFDRIRLLDYLEEQNRQGLPIRDEMELTVSHNIALRLQGELSIGECKDGMSFTVQLRRVGISATAQDAVTDVAVMKPHAGSPEIPQEDLMPKFNAILPTMLLVNEDGDMNLFLRSLFGNEYNIQEVNALRDISGKLANIYPRIILCGTTVLNNEMIDSIRAIRGVKHLEQVPIILLTAFLRPEVKVEGLELGVDLCLPLPFGISHLRSAVERLLRRYDSLRDYGRSVYGSFDLVEGRMLHKEDKAFLDKMLGVIQDNILNTDLSTQFIASQMGVSPANFYRKLRAITAQTPINIIKECRFGLAEQLLVTTRLSIDEIIYRSGFANRSTFFRSFLARFGCTPKIYREQKVSQAMDSIINPAQ